MRPRFISLLLAVLLASSVTAQIGIGRIKTDNLPGDGILPPGAINITEIALAGFGSDGSGLNDFHGVARLPNGHYIVSQGPADLVEKQYFELDGNGNYLGNVVQPFNFTGFNKEGGLKDLAWDGETSDSSRIWAAIGQVIMSYDWQTQAFDDVIMPFSPNGRHALEEHTSFRIQASTIADVDGQKIFVSAGSFGSPNYHTMGLPQITFPKFQDPTAGLAHPSFPPFAGGLGQVGAAYDSIRGTIWWAIDVRPHNPNPNHSAVRFIETDMDGILTGQVIQGIREIGGEAGGCEMYVDARGNAIMAYAVSMSVDVDNNPLGLPPEQDILVEMHMAFQYGSSCGGNIAFLTEPYIGNLGWTLTLENAGANPLGIAFLARGTPVSPPGLAIPGVINCGVLFDPGNFFIEGALPLVNGEVSFVRALPDLPSLIGAEAAFQWLMPSANGGLPLDLSNAGALRVGSNF